MIAVRKHLAVVRERHGGDLERACVHCSACCVARVRVGDTTVFLRSLRCKYLQADAAGESRCAVYDQRFEKAPWCMGIEEAITKAVFPNGCPYVEGLSGYQGPELLPDAAYAVVVDEFRNHHRGEQPPAWADPSAWNEFVNG